MLKISDVGYRYKNSDRETLKNVNAVFERGKFHAIVGPSGSGKTTLLSLMAGLDKPKTGRMSIDGEELSSLDLDFYRREKISMIFQAFQLFPLLTTMENVCYPMEANGMTTKVARERAQVFLQSVGIDESKFKRFPANLSGGEQQRVAIARAVGTGAKVILADEPTGNLDKENGEAVVSILKRLAHEEDYCVITVTHNLEIAESADVTFKMSDGELT
jgi:putative ABC transport system ATP-binding protein